MEKLITKIIKIGQYQFMQSLRNKGEVYFNTVDFFKKADNNKERFDAYETAMDIDQVEWIKLEDETGKIYNLSTEKGKEYTYQMLIWLHIMIQLNGMFSHVQV
jgi:hypothetical protein